MSEAGVQFFLLWCVYTLFSRAICWRDNSSPTERSWHSYKKKQLVINVWVYFWFINSIPFVCMSIFMPVIHCFIYFCFEVSFEVGNCESTNSFFFFPRSQYCFGYSESLAILCRFGNSFSISPRKVIGVLTGLHLSVDCIGVYSHHNNTKSSYFFIYLGFL